MSIPRWIEDQYLQPPEDKDYDDEELYDPWPEEYDLARDREDAWADGDPYECHAG